MHFQKAKIRLKLVLNFIKSLFLRRFISKSSIVREHVLTSLTDAKDVGLLCEITDEQSYQEIMSLFLKLPRRGRTYWLMGYVNDKAVPFYCIQQLTADFICNKEFNWYGKPLKIQIFDFISKEFDMLIDFTNRELPAVQNILSLSHAKFIVGANKKNDQFYDLLIDSEEIFSPFSLLQQIHDYTLKLTGQHDKR